MRVYRIISRKAISDQKGDFNSRHESQAGQLIIVLSLDLSRAVNQYKSLVQDLDASMLAMDVVQWLNTKPQKPRNSFRFSQRRDLGNLAECKLMFQ
jgi:hypothetical protein